jgi:hypothetical protein
MGSPICPSPRKATLTILRISAVSTPPIAEDGAH